MTYESLTVLIPSHSLEDLPLELPEGQAEGLLNGFAVLWHPALLDVVGRMPQWERADDPPSLTEQTLVIVPSISRDWLACQWIDDASETGANVISDIESRQELLDRCLEPLDVPDTLDPDLAADFLAFGHVYLQHELLTRQMRYFSELDEARLESSVLSAARAAIAGDATAARRHLGDCFEMLLESRERFYPVDCHLVDLCLLTTETADEHWDELTRSDKIVSYLTTGEQLRKIADQQPAAIGEVAARWRDERQEFIGGELSEEPTSLLPIDETIRQFTDGLQTYDELLGRRPTVWGRRKFGVGPHMPQLLDKFGYKAAVHFVMDDGMYPDEEQGTFRWEGCDGTVIDATSRIPLAGDSASSFLRFSLRMSESMDYDHAAVVLIARWPEMKSPWLDDFHRMSRYAPVLGKFVTLSEFFNATDTPGRLSKFSTGEYLSPNLLQSVALEQPDPISRYSEKWTQQHRLEVIDWTTGLCGLISGSPVTSSAPHGQHNQPITPNEMTTMAEPLARLLVGGRGSSRGCLVTNSCSFERRVVIDWPDDLPAPATCEAIVSRQWDDSQHSLVFVLPPSGFLWMPCGDDVVRKTKSAVPLAEPGLLRNEFFEVGISEQTGGLCRLKTYSRAPNRLSQQVALRFRHERVETLGEGDETETVRTHYSRMTQTEARILCTGPGVGAIETRGTLTDPQTNELLAEFQQTVTVRRGRPLIEIDLELDIHKEPEGDPWSSYYACRWAWNDSDAGLTASVHEGAHPVTGERFEAPHYVEISANDLRTTILPHGLPFHRKSGPRMLDTLLIVAGETKRRFRFVIAIDETYPMERARDCLSPAPTIVVDDGPAASTSGWLFHLDALNVQIARVLPLMEEEEKEARLGVGLRLRETEGRHRTVQLRSFRTPTSARQRDLTGKTITELTVDGDAVLVEVTAFEVCDVELFFD